MGKMQFEINYSKNFGEKLGSRWLWKTIDASSKQEARTIIFEEHEAEYIVSIRQVS